MKNKCTRNFETYQTDIFFKMVRDVFDNEVGIFMPKSNSGLSFKEDVNATDELADRGIGV